MKNLDVQRVVVRARAGSDVAQCLVEAAVLALSEYRVVILEHNDRAYTVDPAKLIAFVANGGAK